VIRLLGTLALLAALAGCASRPPHPDTFAFGAMGDVPYSEVEAPAVARMIEHMGAQPLAFVVHVGDLKAGSHSPCTDELLAARRAMLDASRHALVLTPGDNDWTDCRRDTNGSMDPLERLAKLRALFFADDWSLGRSRMPLAKQDGCAERAGAACACSGVPENRLWTKAGIVFATIHVVSSNDNKGYDAANDAEQRCRAAANRAWLERALRMAEGPGQRGLVVFGHVNPWLSNRSGVFDTLLAQLAAGGLRLAKPMVFVHGDTHAYTLDRPFRDGLGKPVENIVRLEVPGSPLVGWVRVTVDPNHPALFRFEPQLEAPGGRGN
jgi:hypothetical protein